MSRFLASAGILAVVTLSACVSRRSLLAGRCIESDGSFTEGFDPIEGARSLIDTDFQRAHGLDGVRSEDIVFERDPRVCRAFSLKRGPIPPGPPLDSNPRPVYPDVIVVRFGTKGYWVQTRWHVTGAGEFLCYATIFDRKFREKTKICG